MARVLAEISWWCATRRRAVAVANLLPVFDGDSACARAAAHGLFCEFARKVADLWRFESGAPVAGEFHEQAGWDRFLEAQRRGQGVLLVTLHLGNWELGGPMLAGRGVKLVVLTLAEPGEGFTEMRRAARERWGIETVVVGSDPFGFVGILQRLQDGATVALLLDRPPPAGAVTVELFGRPFAASSAAADLARASGAAIVPVYLPHTPQGYAARVLPEISYNRAALGQREARRALTAEILRAFEPVIRQHPTQWYHFVPLWMPADTGRPTSGVPAPPPGT
jgi:KDO2-lipid IV(A) lauroyltransferase